MLTPWWFPIPFPCSHLFFPSLGLSVVPPTAIHLSLPCKPCCRQETAGISWKSEVLFLGQWAQPSSLAAKRGQSLWWLCCLKQVKHFHSYLGSQGSLLPWSRIPKQSCFSVLLAVLRRPGHISVVFPLGCSAGMPQQVWWGEKKIHTEILTPFNDFLFFPPVSLFLKNTRKPGKYLSHLLRIVFVYICLKNIKKEAPKTRLFTAKWVANSATLVNVAIHFSINYQFILLNAVIKRDKRPEEGGKTWEVYVYCQAFGFMFISWKVTPYIMIIDFTKYLRGGKQTCYKTISCVRGDRAWFFH